MEKASKKIEKIFYNREQFFLRMRYTYDWADNGTNYGLTEFIIRDGSPVDVEFTYTNEKFLNWLAE